MANLNKVLIGDFLKRIRRSVNIEKNEEYKLLTIKLRHKGIVLRCVKKGSEIGTKKMYTVQTGDFILSGIDARNGAFGIVPEEMDGAVVTNDFWYFKVDADVIDKRLFLELTQTSWFDEICRKGSDGTTQRIRLQKDKFYNQEIQLPPKVNHDTLLNKIISVKACSKNLNTEITHQQSLLRRLRQSILQDAISGKLTKKWRKENPDVESATELLARIKTEKERLVKEKKIKKQKPLPPITEHKIPFELPEGWAWTRLGEILNEFLGGYSFKSPLFKKSGINQVLRLGNIRPDLIRFNEKPVFIDDDLAKEAENVKLKPNDLLITMTGTRGKKDYCYTVLLNDTHFLDRILLLNQRVGCFRFNNIVCDKYFNYALKDNGLLEQIFSTATGSANQANIGAASLNSWTVPLPPQKETEIIVSKIEKLFTCCDQLEQQISKSQQDSELLMQAVLKEAFES